MVSFNKVKFNKAYLAKKKILSSRSFKYVLLLVDDENANLKALSSILENDYEILTATDGYEALELVKNESNPERINMIISDQRMPRMTGVEFLKHTISITPKTIRIILTGYTDINVIISSINDGKIYKFITKPFDPQDLKITVKRALENYDLEEKHRKSNQVFEKFVPKQFLSRISDGGISNIEFGKAKTENLTVLFSDIRNFTPLSEGMQPQELMNFLNAYIKRMSDPLRLHHGFIDKFIGDAIMALFDDLGEIKDGHAKDGVKAAIAMQEAIVVYNENRKKAGYQPISMGIGVNTGEVTIGTVGTEDRMDSTVIGDTVNFTARLERLTKYYACQIIISSDTYSILEDDAFFLCRKLDFMIVKGKSRPSNIYEVFNSNPENIRAKKQQILKTYNQALKHYYDKEWDAATDLFYDCLDVYPEDVVSQMYIDRCIKFKKHLPSENWQVFQHDKK